MVSCRGLDFGFASLKRWCSGKDHTSCTRRSDPVKTRVGDLDV